MGAAVKGLILSVIGVDCFHGFLCLFQLCKFAFQLRNGVRVVGTDTAHAGTADFIKQALYLPVFLHVLICCGVLLLLFAYREIASPGNHDRRDAGGDLIAFIHVRRQLLGVSVKQPVNLFMERGVNTLFLPCGNLGGFVYIVAVFCRCASGLVIGKADRFFCAAGGVLVDRVVCNRCFRRLRGGSLRCFAGGRLCLFRNGAFRLLRLFLCFGFSRLLRFGGLCGFLLRRGVRLIPISGVFLHGHSCVCRFLRDFLLDVFLVGFQLHVKIPKLGDGRQVVFALIDKPPALGNIGLYGGMVGGFSGCQTVPVLQGFRGDTFHFREVAMQFQIGDKFIQQHSPVFLVGFQCFLALML